MSYPEPGSNRHGLLHWCLRPARLPIPPSGLVCCCPKTGTRRIDLLVKDCKGIGNFGNCKINDIPWTENPIELTKVELKTFYNSEYHGTLDGNIRESVQGICCQVCSVRYVRPGMFRLRAFFSCPPLHPEGV